MILETILSLLIVPVLAAETFTIEDVALHNTTEDCYMIFEGKVYDFTDYLQEHKDSYLNIDAWCGTDMTEDFQTKAGEGRDHRLFSYEMLDDYYIGDVQVSVAEVFDDSEIESTEETAEDFISEEVKAIKRSVPYNFAIPCFGTLFVYAITGFLVKAGKNKNGWKFNAIVSKFFWNTVLLLSLIPSVLFGFYLVFQYPFPVLREVNFNFLYWHVEGSMVFGTVCIIHFIERIKVYLGQYRSLRK